MNKLILEQLKNCKVAQLPMYDETTTELLIPKGGNPVEVDDFELDHYYIIEVEDYIIKPYEGFTLHDNWNHGLVPKDKRMKVEICQVMGKMIRVEAVGEETGSSWSGWLPRKSMHRISELL